MAGRNGFALDERITHETADYRGRGFLAADLERLVGGVSGPIVFYKIANDSRR